MKESIIKPYLLSPMEAALFTGLGRSKIYELIHSGEIPCLYVGTHIRIRVRDIEAWADDAIPEKG